MLTSLTQYLPVLAALGAVIALVFLAGKAARVTRYGQRYARGKTFGKTTLTVVDTLSIDRVRRLHVIRWQGRDLLLLTGGPLDRLISSAPTSEPQS